MPHCLGLPFWHYQLVLSWYIHQPESHQFSLQKLSQFQRTGPIDRTPGTPGSDKNTLYHYQLVRQSQYFPMLLAWNQTSKGPFETRGWVELTRFSVQCMYRGLSGRRLRRTKSPQGSARVAKNLVQYIYDHLTYRYIGTPHMIIYTPIYEHNLYIYGLLIYRYMGSDVVRSSLLTYCSIL